MESVAASFVETVSSHGFVDTLSRLEQVIADKGLLIFARIDHAQGAREFGLEMPRSVVLIYGHPRGGTSIMLDYPEAALDLPLRLLVHEKANGQTVVLFRPIDAALKAAGVPKDMAMKLAPAQHLIIAAIGEASVRNTPDA